MAIQTDILFKFATRGRPDLFFPLLDKYTKFLSGETQARFVISLDEDDASMTSQESIIKLGNLSSYKDYVSYNVCFNKPPSTKVSAINANMDGEDFDILVNLSDDMIVLERGYDKVIEDRMLQYFPNLDGALNFTDGLSSKPRQLITLSVMGKRLYDAIGYIYDPNFCSFFCDDRFTDIVKALDKYRFIDEMIIEHKHCGKWNPDEVFKKNNLFWRKDEQYYLSTKNIENEVNRIKRNLDDNRNSLPKDKK